MGGGATIANTCALPRGSRLVEHLPDCLERRDAVSFGADSGIGYTTAEATHEVPTGADRPDGANGAIMRAGLDGIYVRRASMLVWPPLLILSISW